jgi:hypothetical protein
MRCDPADSLRLAGLSPVRVGSDAVERETGVSRGFSAHLPPIRFSYPNGSERMRTRSTGELGPQLAAFFTSAPILASSAAVNFVRA